MKIARSTEKIRDLATKTTKIEHTKEKQNIQSYRKNFPKSYILKKGSTGARNQKRRMQRRPQYLYAKWERVWKIWKFKIEASKKHN